MQSVSHTIEAFRIVIWHQGYVLSWIKSYSLCVSVADKTPSDVRLPFGVPQESVLELQNYCIYTKPVRKNIKPHHVFFFKLLLLLLVV